jgi:hypothetical protein
MLACVYIPCCPANSCVIGFLTLMPLTASLRSGRELRLYIVSWSPILRVGALAYHSGGGMTLTMPDFIPCLSILSMKRLKLRNWSMVCINDS